MSSGHGIIILGQLNMFEEARNQGTGNCLLGW